MILTANRINPPIKAILSTFLKVDDSDVARIPMHGPLIIATNHINSLDAPVGFSHLHPRPLTAFVKIETWNQAVLGRLFDAWDTIPIHRGEVDFTAFKRAESALARGKIVVVAPEGTRSHHGRLNIGYPGISYLAMRTKAPILPVVFFGNENFWGKFTPLRRTKMTIKVGNPFYLKIPTGEQFRDIRQQITDEIMYEIARLLPETHHGYYSGVEHAQQKYLEFFDFTKQQIDAKND